MPRSAPPARASAWGRIAAALAFTSGAVLAAACAEALGVGNTQLTECQADGLALAANDAAPPSGCEACAETACCGLVGRCRAEDPCRDEVLGHVACVSEKIRARDVSDPEAACSGSRPTGLGLDAFTCLRDKCGRECNVQTCRVDVAAPRLGGPRCDACLVARACDSINACYKDRGCRLFLECVAKVPGCVRELTRAPAPGVCDAGLAPRLPACAASCAEAGIGDACVTLPLLGSMTASGCDCEAPADAAAD